MENPKIAIIGCGDWGKNLIRNHAELGSLAAIVDARADLATRFAKDYGVEARELDAVLADDTIAGLVIATPGPTHRELACAGFAAGKHVYVEKPLAMTLADGEEICAAAEKSERHLMVGHLLQYHAVFVRLREMVAGGALGRVRYIYSNRLNFGKILAAEDALWSLAPHDISMVLALAGDAPQSVTFDYADILQKGVADKAMVFMRFADGLRAHIAVSWLNPIKEQRLVVIGDDAMAVFDDTNPWEDKLMLYPNRVALGEGDPSITRGDAERVMVAEAEPLKMECQYFLDLIAGRVAPRTDGAEAMRVLRVLTSATPA